MTVLMYHKTIDTGHTDLLTVTRHQLEEQFQFFLREGYNCVSLKEIIDHISTGSPLKKKSLLLTFDDGYRNNLTVLYPLLQQYNLKAVIFLVPGYIEKAEAKKGLEYLDIKDIHVMDPGVVEFGLHTYDHKNYNSLELEAIEEDIAKTKNWFEKSKINYSPAWAYTYGDFPKNNKTKLAGLFNIFEKHGIQIAFNIGNRINSLPLKKKFVIQRIDVRGTESLSQFVSKVKNGKELVGFIKDIIGKP
ncbi:MAG TPA: polysaccharide deacetylase family protein [Chitinophagaceae bacterium]|nr:polysaccharide deacetylase family protein [Chitinophagaceae bacterium]